MNTSRYYLAGCGTQTAALGFGGNNPGDTGATESYNGTSWTSVSSMNTARGLLAGAGTGTQTAALAFGGYIGAAVATTESYNGSTWSPTTNLSTARYRLGGAGTQTAGLAFGGETGPVNTTATEEFTGAFLSNKKITTS
jgi:hypothetical protein